MRRSDAEKATIFTKSMSFFSQNYGVGVSFLKTNFVVLTVNGAWRGCGRQ